VSGSYCLQQFCNFYLKNHDKDDAGLTNYVKKIGGVYPTQADEVLFRGYCIKQIAGNLFPIPWNIVRGCCVKPNSHRSSLQTNLRKIKYYSIALINPEKGLGALCCKLRDELLLKKKENIAATKIKSVWRGQRIRRRVVFPSELMPFLNRYISACSKYKKLELARCLCREIIKMSLDPNAMKGGPKPFSQCDEGYIFAHRLDDGRSFTRKLHFKYDVWLIPDPKKNGITICITRKRHLDMIGRGSYKIIKKAPSFFVPFEKKKNKHRMIRYEENVLSQSLQLQDLPQKETTNELFTKQSIRSGLDMHKVLYSALGNEIGIPKPPLLVQEVKRGRVVERVEYVEEWINANLSQAVRGPIPLHMQEDETDKVPLNLVLKGLEDAVGYLDKMHNIGIIHGDFSPRNVMLQVKKIKNSRGFIDLVVKSKIIDFDTTGYIAENQLLAPEDYPLEFFRYQRSEI